MKRLLVSVSFILTFYFPQIVFAAHSLEISSDKTSLSPDDEVSLTLHFSGFTSGEIVHAKGVFFKEGSTNYFGFSKTDSDWVKNNISSVHQPTIHIDSSNTLLLKNDSTDSGFEGEGDYTVKVGYYYQTSGGNLSSVTWSKNTLPMHLSSPRPTNTPIPTSTPTLLPTPTNKPSISETTQENVLEDSEISPAQIPMVERVITPAKTLKETTPSPTITQFQMQVEGIKTKKQSPLPILFGLGMIGICAILICRKLWNLKFPFEQ